MNSVPSSLLGALCLSLFIIASSVVLAVPPPSVLNQQGRIVVDGSNYGSPGSATGYFKFALVNDGATETFWTNNGSNVGSPGGEPNAAVPVTVSNGHYSLGLGDVALTNMTTAIPATVFENNAEVFLAVWFSTDMGGPYELLAPNRRITSGGYALHAAKAEGVIDGGITNAMLAAGSITADKFDGGLSLDDADADPTNELQNIGRVGNSVVLSNGGGNANIDDADANPVNELQSITRLGSTITLSNGGGSVSVDDDDASSSNEFNQSLSLGGTILKITDGGSSLTTDLASLVNDADASPVNEIQSLSFVAPNLSISGGNSVNLSSLVDDGDWGYFSGSGLSGELTRSGDVALGALTDPDGYGLNVQSYTFGKAAVRGVDQTGTGTTYAEGMLGVLVDGTLGLPVSVTNIGVLGLGPAEGGTTASVYGWNNDDNSSNYAGLFVADGASAFGTNYGVYAKAANNAVRNVAGYFEGEVEVVGNASITSDLTVDGRGAFGTGLLPGVGMVVRGADLLDTNEALIVEGSDGIDIIHVENSGQVGIGTTGPNAPLHVNGDGVGVAFRVQNSGATKLVVNPNGGVTVGTNSTFSPANGLYVNGAVTIGISSSGAAAGYELSVDGGIACEEVLVDLSGSWPDYVFADDYELRPLSEVEAHIEAKKHLPGIPSAAQVEEDGIKLAEMQTRMMEKIEELTLYAIQQQKLLEAQALEIEKLKSQVNSAY